MNAEEFPFVVIGNKCDLQDDREVSDSQVEEWCAKGNLPHFETSAKDAINVAQAFDSVAKLALVYEANNKELYYNKYSMGGVVFDEDDEKKSAASSRCC